MVSQLTLHWITSFTQIEDAVVSLRPSTGVSLIYVCVDPELGRCSPSSPSSQFCWHTPRQVLFGRGERRRRFGLRFVLSLGPPTPPSFTIWKIQ